MAVTPPPYPATHAPSPRTPRPAPTPRPRPCGGWSGRRRRMRGWDSSRTKTNAPVAWMVHALMGHIGFFLAERPMRNRLLSARDDVVVPRRGKVRAVLGSDLGRTSPSRPLRLRSPKAQAIRLSWLTLTWRRNEQKSQILGKSWLRWCRGLRDRRGRVAPLYGESAPLNRRSVQSVGFCPYEKSVVMERRWRMEPSPPAFSTLITLHNYWPGSRATKCPRCVRPTLEPIETGTGWAGIGAHERRRCLERGHEHAAPLQWSPGGRHRYGKSFHGSTNRKSQFLRDLRPFWSSVLCITINFP